MLQAPEEEQREVETAPRRRTRARPEPPGPEAPEVEVSEPEGTIAAPPDGYEETADAQYPAGEESYDFEPEAPLPEPLAAGYAAANPSASRLALLVAVYAAGVLLFLAIEPTKPWILLVVTALVALGADGLLRAHPQGEFEGDPAATAPYLFLPALFTLGSGLFLEDVLQGYLALLGVIGGAGLAGALMYADYVSVDPHHRGYPLARLILNIGTYLTAFAFFAVVYTFDVSLVPAAVAVGLVTLLLSVEVLREAEADPVRALVYSAVVGLVVAEARWSLYFLPLESYLAAVFLLLVFYLASGLVQHHLADDLRGPVIVEFVAIAILGVLIVAAGRVFESSGSL